MFGYIAPLKPELRLRELEDYNAYYCGLCKTLGRRYGLFARNVLNYDCTFLGLLLSSMRESASVKRESCLYNPLVKKNIVTDEALCYASDINVLLTFYKLIDDWQDDKNVAAFLGSALFQAASKKAEGYRPEAAKEIKYYMEQLNLLEKKACSVPDEVADAFASLLRKVFELSPGLTKKESHAAGWMGYNLGRWIYLIDAWKDRKQDAKTGAYNIYNISYSDEDTARESADFQLHASLEAAVNAYELLDIKVNKPLIDNILYQGCGAKTAALLCAEGDSK